jgi:RNA polymerase sigma-70 factor (ECF subfamily)
MAYVMKRTRREADFFLVQRAICGDQSAYTKIYEDYQKSVRYVVTKILYRRPMEVEDVCMETFERAFSLLHRFQPDYQLSAWLVRIASNRALDCLRRGNRLDVTADDDSPVLELQLMDDAPLPMEQVERTQDISYLNSLMEELPDNERDALRMRCLDGLSSDECAEQMGTTRRTVRHSVRDGIHHLKSMVDKTDVELRSK